jgi:hypothetical protein
MFIVMSSDDNAITGENKFEGGIKWYLEFTKEKKNPSGKLNEKTFDG